MTDTTTDAPEEGALEAQLDAWLEGALEDLDGSPENVHQVTTLVGALRAVHRRMAEVNDTAAHRIDAIAMWRDTTVEPLLRREAELQGLVHGWALAQWEETGRQTWKLPTGIVTARPRMPRVVQDPSVPDEEVVGAAGRASERYVRVATAVAVSEVKSDAIPGDVIAGYVAPDGYEARTVLVPHVDGTLTPKGPDGGKWRTVVGLVFLTPVEGRGGRNPKVAT